MELPAAPAELDPTGYDAILECKRKVITEKLLCVAIAVRIDRDVNSLVAGFETPARQACGRSPPSIP